MNLLTRLLGSPLATYSCFYEFRVRNFSITFTADVLTHGKCGLIDLKTYSHADLFSTYVVRHMQEEDWRIPHFGSSSLQIHS